MNDTLMLNKPEFDKSQTFLKAYEWMSADTTAHWLNVEEHYTPPRWTLSYGGAPFAPLGGIHALTGQPGNGKTMAFTMLMVALLRGEYMGLRCELAQGAEEEEGAEAQAAPVSILYIDTEMEHGNTLLVNQRVYAMMGWQQGVPHPEFRILCLREVTAATDRWRLTLKAIYEERPTVVFLDGMLDVISDFNDNAACQQIIYDCMATASHYGISLWCLVHENPGSTKMVGHLGSMLERKVTDTLGVRKKKESGTVTFEIVQKKARGRDLDDIRFHVVDGPYHYGIPEILSTQVAKAEKEEEPDREEFVREFFKGKKEVTTRSLFEAVKKVFNISTKNTEKLIHELEDTGMIERNENKKYRISDYLTKQQTFLDGNGVPDCPF